MCVHMCIYVLVLCFVCVRVRVFMCVCAHMCVYMCVYVCVCRLVDEPPVFGSQPVSVNSHLPGDSGVWYLGNPSKKIYGSSSLAVPSP